MSKRYRLVAIAFGLALTLGALAQETIPPALESEPESESRQEQGAPASEQNAAPEQPSASQLLSAIQSIEAAIRALIAEEDEVAREEERNRNRADLRAQEMMALWAKWMFFAAVASVLLTGVGVFLIWNTLLHTRDAAIHAGRAVDEAKNATKAAQDAVTVTRDIGEAQTRAYLYCNSARYKVSRSSVSATIDLKNSGQSPASDVNIRGTASVNSVIGMPARPRVGSWISSDSASAYFQPISSNGTGVEEVIFTYDYHFATQIEENEIEIKTDAWENGNEVMFDLEVHWKDVFGVSHTFDLSLYAIFDASPYNLRKKRSPTGKLDFRMEDARHRVSLADEDKPVD